MEQIVITAAAAVCVFLAALVLMRKMSSPGSPGRRGGSRGRDWRTAAMAAPPRVGTHRNQEERPWSFGAEADEGNGGAPGYGRPPGYRPPPLWTEPGYEPRGGR